MFKSITLKRETSLLFDCEFSSPAGPFLRHTSGFFSAGPFLRHTSGFVSAGPFLGHTSDSLSVLNDTEGFVGAKFTVGLDVGESLTSGGLPRGWRLWELRILDISSKACFSGM